MPKVVLTDPFPPAFLERVRAALPASVEFAGVPSDAEDVFARLASDADVLFVVHRRIDEHLLRLAPRVRFVQRAGIGYDNLDLDALHRRGILVAYCPGANAAAVAEHAIMLMLALLKRLIPADDAIHAGRWPQGEMLATGIGDLAGATVGLLGLGSIGQEVAKRLRPFGATVRYCTRRRVAADLEAGLGVQYLPFGELLETSTILSLHVPLSEETRGLLGEAEFALMPRGAYLINTARGELVDESALRRALADGHLGGAGLDVMQTEAAGGNPFGGLSNVVCTPHIGGASRNAVAQIMQQSVLNLGRFLQGQQPLNLIPQREA